MITSVHFKNFCVACKNTIFPASPTLVYIFKVLLASFMALGISLKFELEQPRTAMMTVAIVMHSRSGMVFTKSIYRLLGTLVGVAASFLLVAMFAQERVLFLLCMAIWIGICTAGSMIFRHHQSYGFVLAGYTICIVGLPATINPELTFNIGVTRVSEIMIGLLCAGLVSDLIFPQRIWTVVSASISKRFSDFSDLVIAMEPGRTRVASGSHRVKASPIIRFVTDIFELESLSASSSLENDDSRTYRLKLNHLNSAFMEVSTTFHSLQQLLRRHEDYSNPIVSECIGELYQHLKAALLFEGHVAQSSSQASVVAIQIRQYRESLPSLLKDSRAQLLRKLNAHAQADSDRLDFETGVELLQRFVDELYAYAMTYASLADANGQSGMAKNEPPHFKLDFDVLTAAFAGLRGILTLVILTAMWIFLDWRSGVEAITLGVITSTLFASSRSPSKTVRQFLIGALIGTFFLYLCNFYLLPNAKDFLMLMLVLAPAIAFAAWVTTRQAYATIGAGVFIIFLMHSGFNAALSAEPVIFINDAIADIMAITLAGVMYELIDLTNGRWSQQRLSKNLHKLIVFSCEGPLKLARVEMERRLRSLGYRFSGAWQGGTRGDGEMVDHLLSSIEIGHAVIALRELLAEIGSRSSLKAGDEIVKGVAQFYASPSHRRHDLVVASIAEGLADLDTDISKKELAQGIRLQFLTTLHLLRSVLLDEASVFSSFRPMNDLERTK